MRLYEKFIDADKLPEYRLLLSLIRFDLKKEKTGIAARLLDGRGIDWGTVLHLAGRHRVLPVFYSNLKKTGLFASLPEFTRNRFFSQYVGVVGYNMRLRKKLTEVLALFERRNIPAVPVKGSVLSLDVYGDSAMRYCQDMDILVPERCVAPARDALLKAGFRSPVQQLYGNQFEQILKYCRECDFLDNTGRFHIDLHWRLGGPFRRRYDYEFCRKRLRKIRFHDRNISVLSPEDTLLHLCVNSSTDIWQSLEKILCVAEFIDRHSRLDWEKLRKLADELHCKRMLFTGLFLARDVFGTALPSKIAEQLEKDKAIARIVENIYVRLFQGLNFKSHIVMQAALLPYYLSIRDDFSDKALYLFCRIFVPTKKDWQNRVTNSRSSFFYFLLRPYELVLEFWTAYMHSKPQSR